MMGIGRCKDLDEWLVGSGESAETADSKRFVNGLNGIATQFMSEGINGQSQDDDA